MTDLPRGWTEVTIADVAQTSLGKMLDKKKATGQHPTPYLRNINVRWGSFDVDDVATMDIAPKELERVLARPGDVVACEGGEPGRAAVWRGPEPIALQKALHKIRPSQAVRSAYLAYALRYLADTGLLEPFFTGSTIKHLPQQQLRRVPIPLPPLAEQERIVAAIEKHFSHLDAAEAFLHRAEARTETVLVSRLAEIFLRAGNEGIERRPLGDLLDHTIGGVWGGPPGSGEVDVDVMRVTEFRNDGSLEPATAARRSISEKQLTSRRLKPGDLLLEKSGGGPTQPVGRVVRLPDLTQAAVPTNFVQLLRPEPDVDPGFLFWQLWWWHRSGVVNEYQRATTNIRNLKTKDYLRREATVPPKSEQMALVQELDELRHGVDRLTADLQRGQLRSGHLRRAILAAAFSGRLVPQDPADEPASVLLDRIRAESPTKTKSTRKKKPA